MKSPEQHFEDWRGLLLKGHDPAEALNSYAEMQARESRRLANAAMDASAREAWARRELVDYDPA